MNYKKKKKREFWGALINHGDVVCTHRFSSHSLVLGENQVSVITNKQNRKEYGFDSERSTMKNDHNNNSAEHSKDTTVGILDSRFNQTLRNVQGLLKGRNIPGKILLSQRVESPDYTSLSSPTYIRSSSYSETGTSDQTSETVEEEVHSTSKPFGIPNDNKLKISASNVESSSEEVRKSSMGARATDSARVMKFTKVLSETMVKLEKLREFSWSGVPDYMRPTVWRLLLGYAPPNSDRREGVLKRKRLEYLDCVSQYYDIPDTERSDDEINMLRQIAVDCPITVPEVSFFQQQQVQKSLERILAIRHPASGYVQGINDLVTPFLVVFLSEYLEGGIDNWSMSDLSSDEISNIEADCYWCLSKLLDGMQDHYTFAQPGIQRLVFKLKELVRRIDDPASNHMEEQGLEFLQFAFRWFNCLLIREIPFHLVTRLWDTYLAEGDALPDFLVYISASFLLTWSDKLQKLDFQEMVMFLQHLPTKNWTQQELEMVLSRAFMWHSMFNNSPSHLAN
ncbi:TBC1 domain family member 22B [Glycine soja]